MTEYTLTERALKGDLSILADPDVALTLPDINLGTPLHYLAQKGHKEVLSHPQVATIRDKNGWTPLMYLAREGNIAVLGHPEVTSVFEVTFFKKTISFTPLHLLAENFCDSQTSKNIVNHPMISIVRNSEGETPLHTLAQRRISGVLSHPDVGIVADKNGVTPLHLLAQAELTEVLKHPQVAVVADKNGNTALHWFANTFGGIRFPWQKIPDASIAELLKHPQVATVRNNEGKTPLEIAASEGHKEAVTMLEEFKKKAHPEAELDR